MVGQVRCHARIDDDLPSTNSPCHHTNCRTARQEVQHHLRRNLLRVAGNALRHHAVVARCNDYCLATDGWAFCAKNARELHRHVFQPSKTTRRLGQITLTAQGAPHSTGVRRLNRGYYFRKHPRHPIHP